MSYSYYLMHGLALKGLFLALSIAAPAARGSAWAFWLLMPLFFAGTLLASAALFLGIEKPLSLKPRRARVS